MKHIAKRTLLFLLYIVICVTESSAQIVDFSQVYTNYVYLNPAFVGVYSCPNVYTSFRTKNSLSGGYNSEYVSFDMELNKSNSAIGVSLLHDMQDNVFNQTQLLTMYAHMFQVQKRLYVALSMAAGYSYASTDYSNLVFSDMLNVFQDGVTPTGEDLTKKVRHNFNSEMGALVYNDMFYSGITIKNLQGNITENNKNENLFPRIFSFHSMAKFSTTKAFTQKYLIWFYPHVNVVVGGTSSYAQLGLILQKWMVQFGGAYRQNIPMNANSFTIFIGIVEKKFRFAYNCVMTNNSTKLIGTHEVSLSYQFDCREKKKKYEAVKAPTF